MSVRAEVKGLLQARKKIEQMVRDMAGDAFLQAMKNATLIVQRSAKQNAPVRTNRLRASIVPEIRREGMAVMGVVGSNVSYAPKVERPGPVRRSGRRPYLLPAFKDNEARVKRILDDAVKTIVEA
jgi:HK97 gp10 family phage protein